MACSKQVNVSQQWRWAVATCSKHVWISQSCRTKETKENILYGSIYVRFRNRQYLPCCVRSQHNSYLLGERGSNWKGTCERALRESIMFYFFIWVVLTDNSWNCATLIHFSMCMLYFSVFNLWGFLKKIKFSILIKHF